MAESPNNVRRVLHMKLRAVGDPQQMLSLMQGATPFYRAFGTSQVRILKNVDDPAQFLVEIAYEADAGLELNRQKVAAIVCRYRSPRTMRSRLIMRPENCSKLWRKTP